MTTRLRLFRLRDRRHDVERAMVASMSVPYVRRCAAIIERMEAVEKGLLSRELVAKIRRLPDELRVWLATK